MSVPAGKYVKTAKASSATSCASGYTSSAHDVKYGNTSSCVSNTFTVTYNANGGSGSMTATTCNYGVDCNLRDNSYTKSGSTFGGWGTSAANCKAGTIAYSNKQNVKDKGALNLYACWYHMEYRQKYYNSCKTGSPNTPSTCWVGEYEYYPGYSRGQSVGFCNSYIYPQCPPECGGTDANCPGPCTYTCAHWNARHHEVSCTVNTCVGGYENYWLSWSTTYCNSSNSWCESRKVWE